MLTLARRSAVLGTLIVTFCGFALAQTPVVRKGLFRGRVVTYKVTKGHRIFEGDIALDHVQEITTGVGGFGLGYGYTSICGPKLAASIKCLTQSPQVIRRSSIPSTLLTLHSRDCYSGSRVPPKQIGSTSILIRMITAASAIPISDV